MVYDPNTTQRDANGRSDAPVSTGIPFWDMMLSFGKASQQAMAGYAPRAAAAPGTTTCHVVTQGNGEIAVAGACDGVLLVVSTGSALAATADVAAQLAVVDRPVNLVVLVPPAVLSAAGATTDVRDAPVLAQPGR